MARRGILDIDTLTPSLQSLLPRIDAGVDLAFDVATAAAETYARLNAPWTDRTGNARAGLMAQHDKVPMVSHSLTVYHTMPYGVWLEVRWSGRYAIIGPTLVAISEELSANIAAAVHRATQGQA